MNNAQKSFIVIAIIAIAIAGKSAYDFNQQRNISKGASTKAELQHMRAKQQLAAVEIEKKQRPESELNTLVALRVFEPVPRESYPETAARTGKSFDRVQTIRQAAAFHALRYSNCDYVEWSELSPKSTPNNLIMETKCKNGLDFNISETDIKNQSTPVHFRR